MSFTLPTLPFPRDATNVPYIASPDDNGNYAVASGNWFKKYDSVSGRYFWAPVSSTDPLPVVEDDVRTKLQSIIGYYATLGSTAPTKGLLAAGTDGTNARALKTATDGTVLTQLTGSYATIKSAPVVGAKTITTTAAEIFAGASRLTNRYAMIVYNESSVPIYWGPSSVTTSNGFTLLPQDSIVFQFNPAVATAVYFVANSNATVRVVELA